MIDYTTAFNIGFGAVICIVIQFVTLIMVLIYKSGLEL